jgi:hypothetical protein
MKSDLNSFRESLRLRLKNNSETSWTAAGSFQGVYWLKETQGNLYKPKAKQIVKELMESGKKISLSNLM